MRSYLASTVGAGCLILLLTAGAAAQAAPDSASPTTPVPAATRLAAAEQAYAELRLDEADTEIRAFFDQLEAGGDSTITREERAHAHVLAASIARARGDLAASDAALDAALAVDPSLRLDPALHPPPVLEALERRRSVRTLSTPIAPVEEPAVGPVASTPIGPDVVDTTPDDPWPWVGLGVGAAILVGGVVALSVVFATPPSSFDVRGTIVP